MPEIWFVVLAVFMGEAVLLWWCYPQLKQVWGIPFGANYVVLALLYFYIVFGYMCIFAGFNWESCWVCLTLLFSCLFLSALFWGLKSQSFAAAYICVFLALFSVTAWFYVPHKEGALSFLIALPIGGAFLLVYFLGNVVFPVSEKQQSEPDYLNRTDIYRRLVEEIRCLAGRRLKAESENAEKTQKKNAPGVNVALCSPWGSGKSHFLRYLCSQVAEADETSRGWQYPFAIKHVDVWKVSEEKELWQSVNEALIAAVLGEENARLFYAEKTFVHSLLSVTADGSVAQNIYDLIYHKGDNFSVQRINERIAGKRVLLIFEDLERAKPEMLEALLPLIDRLRKINNMVSICSVDREELERRLGGEAPDRPQSYISKVFDRCLYLPAPEPQEVEVMQHRLQENRFRTSSLIPALFGQFPHYFETPRKLIRVFEALESLERLHLWKLTQMEGFSFASLPGKTDFFPILLICEVEIIRACEPELLETLILNGGLHPFFCLCPAAEMEDLLKEEERNYANFLDSVPANISFYRNAPSELFALYPGMKKVIMDNGCVLAALAYLYRFRELDALEAYFVYAVTRGYEHDGNLLSRMCELLAQGSAASSPEPEVAREPTPEPSTDVVIPAVTPAVPVMSAAPAEPAEPVASVAGEAFSPARTPQDVGLPTEVSLPSGQHTVVIPGQSVPLSVASATPLELYIGDYGRYLRWGEAARFLQQRNRDYPMVIGYYTKCTGMEFVQLLLRSTDADKVRHRSAEQNFEKLVYLYQSMRMSQQALVLNSAFYLNGSRNRDAEFLDGKYQRWLNESDTNMQRLGKLCEIFAQKLFCVAVNHGAFEREKEKAVYDHHFHPYKRLRNERLIGHFLEGFRQACSRTDYTYEDMMISFVDFLGIQYRNGQPFMPSSSSFATSQMATLMGHLHDIICAEKQKKSSVLLPARDVARTCERTLRTLHSDLARWQCSSRKNQNYIEGIRQLITLVNHIRLEHL